MSKKTLPAKPKEHRISCRATPDILKAINNAAERIGVSDADIVRMAIKKFLDSEQKQAA